MYQPTTTEVLLYRRDEVNAAVDIATSIVGYDVLLFCLNDYNRRVGKSIILKFRRHQHIVCNQTYRVIFCIQYLFYSQNF